MKRRPVMEFEFFDFDFDFDFRKEGGNIRQEMDVSYPEQRVQSGMKIETNEDESWWTKEGYI